jgi:SAM-dependent methyltransferase
MGLTNQVFALGYDPFLAWGERAGLRARRRELLAGATGSVVEIGAGSGLNAPLYPASVDRVVFTEPDPGMRRQLARRVADAGPPRSEVLDALADRLPLATGTVDTVVSTFVLCTVADLPATLDELRRVLAPAGRLLIIEHVRAAEPGLRRWQDRLHGPWRAFAAGCHCNRDIVAALHGAGFDVDALGTGRWRRMPPLVSPLVFGPVPPREADG